MRNKLIYIATPYSHKDKNVMKQRFDLVNKFCGHLINDKGLNVYSPISHMHPIAVQCDLPKDWVFWEQFDTTMISRCQEMYVFSQQGWRESKGVMAEIKMAEDLFNIPVKFFGIDFSFHGELK